MLGLFVTSANGRVKVRVPQVRVWIMLFAPCSVYHALHTDLLDLFLSVSHCIIMTPSTNFLNSTGYEPVWRRPSWPIGSYLSDCSQHHTHNSTNSIDSNTHQTQARSSTTIQGV